MKPAKPFPHADFLSQLERILLTPDEARLPTPAAGRLAQLLIARKAMLQASADTDAVADALRRYQKFARPGQPSPHIVQLRQQQAAARQAASQSKQALVKAAAAFVREAGIDVPQRIALEAFIVHWIDANVPMDAVVAT